MHVSRSLCSVCGDPLEPADKFCRICLEPRRQPRRRILPRNRLLSCILLPLLFVGTCSALIPLGMTIADPMTNISLQAASQRRFPVLVMTGDTLRVELLQDLRRIPSLPAGSSYLVPRGREKAVEAALNASHPPGTEGIWVLRVRQISRARQRIELFWMNDGYVGGAYEATQTSIAPLHRKMTGPGFAFIFGGVALLINIAMWSVLWFGIRAWARYRRQTRMPPRTTSSAFH